VWNNFGVESTFVLTVLLSSLQFKHTIVIAELSSMSFPMCSFLGLHKWMPYPFLSLRNLHLSPSQKRGSCKVTIMKIISLPKTHMKIMILDISVSMHIAQAWLATAQQIKQPISFIILYVETVCFKKLIFLFKINFFIFLNYFDLLISKIIFKK
jgi:hypothetical protein